MLPRVFRGGGSLKCCERLSQMLGMPNLGMSCPGLVPQRAKAERCDAHRGTSCRPASSLPMRRVALRPGLPVRRVALRPGLPARRVALRPRSRCGSSLHVPGFRCSIMRFSLRFSSQAKGEPTSLMGLGKEFGFPNYARTGRVFSDFNELITHIKREEYAMTL